MKRIEINIPKKTPYNVYLGTNSFSKLNYFINKFKLHKNVLAVIDKQVYKYHGKKLEEEFNKFSSAFRIIKVKASEDLKTTMTLNEIYKSLLKYKYGRDTLLLAVGGGIIGDVAGFAAATYNRGIQFVQVPTTLLAAVDSSVGGKTGINFGGIKNSIGAFYQPGFVIIDPEFFISLAKTEVMCGLGEVIKYGFLAGEKFYSNVIKNIDSIFELRNDVVENIIAESIKFKRDVVIIDEKEKSLRKILNLGHTFAHAIEVDQNYKIKHGAAVLAGIACSLFLSNRLGLLSNAKLDKFLPSIIKAGAGIKIKRYDKNSMLKIMTQDKKSITGRIKFVLIQDTGKIIIDAEADNKDIFYALVNGLKLFS